MQAFPASRRATLYEFARGDLSATARRPAGQEAVTAGGATPSRPEIRTFATKNLVDIESASPREIFRFFKGINFLPIYAINGVAVQLDCVFLAPAHKTGFLTPNIRDFRIVLT
jgi:hypothetical protein